MQATGYRPPGFRDCGSGIDKTFHISITVCASKWYWRLGWINARWNGRNRRTGRRMMLDSYDRRWDRRFPALTGIKRGLIELHAQLPTYLNHGIIIMSPTPPSSQPVLRRFMRLWRVLATTLSSPEWFASGGTQYICAMRFALTSNFAAPVARNVANLDFGNVGARSSKADLPRFPQTRSMFETIDSSH
jgi:hypothetical protein